MTPVIVFEIACHHSIETFSSVFSQGTTYLVMIVLMHGSIPHVTILPGMPPGDDFKFSFFSQLAVYSPTRGTGRTGLVMNHNYFVLGAS